MRKHAHNFLIVRLGALGDVIHGIPVSAALRVRFPDARIDWMVDPRYLDLLRMVPSVDHPVPVDPRRHLGALLAMLRDLRRLRYTAAIDLQGLLKSAVLTRAVGAERTIGFPRGHLREPLAHFLYQVRPDPGARRHVVQKNLALLEPLGVATTTAEFPLHVNETDASEAVREMFGSERYMVINPGAAWPNKRWPAERFAAVAAAARDDLGLRSLVVWGPGEEKLAAEVVAGSGGAAAVAPPTGIPDLAAIARGAQLVVSGDTGPLHLAAAVGTATVALFGPTNPQRNGSWVASDISLSRVEQCSCVYERRCRRSSPCIDDIRTEEVVHAIRRRIGARV